MMWWRRSLALLSALCLLVGTTASPVRRGPEDLEARRRSAIDRNFVRFGRSYPSEVSAADIREALQRPARRSNNFLRLGRSNPLSTNDILSLMSRAYNEEDSSSPMEKRTQHIIRLGRDPNFVRFGRGQEEQTSDFVVNGYPERQNRARDHFLRLGRDSEELTDANEVDEEPMDDSRRKRSTLAACKDCHS